MLIETTRNEQEVFDDLENLCSSPGYIHVLAYISLRDNFISYDVDLTSEAMAASYKPKRTIRTEFATLSGLMLKNSINFSLPAPFKMQEYIEKTHTLLEELHVCLNRPMIESLKRSFLVKREGLLINSTQPFRSGEELREPIFYGGESAYSFQYRDFSVERYAKDSDWMLRNFGFTISDGRTISEAISRLLNRKVVETFKAMNLLSPTEWTVLPGFSFSLAAISAESGCAPELASAVLAALTAPASPTNGSFTSLGEFNIANACPILRSPSGEYVSLDSYGIAEALYDSPFYWMAADAAYKDTAFANRGAFLEEFVAKRLVEVFGAAHVHRNVNILRRGKCVSEIDVLVLFADRAIVCQCKSKKLTLEARKGNDRQLQNDFKKSVQDAYDQALVCAKSLSDNSLKFIGEDGCEISLSTLREIYPVCVVSDHYPALTVQASEFLTFHTSDTIHPPLITDVFFIDVLIEMLTSPLRFLSYINRRVGIGDRVTSINELSILGYHLRQNLWIDEQFDRMMLDDSIAIDLDTAMTVRREGMSGERTPKGILTLLDGTLVGRMVQAIENRPEAELVDLGFMLLTLSGDTLKTLDRGLKKVCKLTKSDGKNHDLTLAFDKGQTGLTVHCGALSNAEAAEKLASHCSLRKYAQRAESWFGLVVRTEDGLPKFGLNLKFPWVQDDAMDDATKGMANGKTLPQGLAMFKSHKIGRNDPCPCGSGRKFKKCCIK